MMKQEDIVCPICRRDVPSIYQEEHHLIPKSKKGKDTVTVCKNCGDMVHKLFTNKELARIYNTIEAINAHPDVQTWVKWVNKKPDDFSVCMKAKKTKNRKRR